MSAAPGGIGPRARTRWRLLSRVAAVALSLPVSLSAQTRRDAPLGHGVHSFVDEETYAVQGRSFREAYAQIQAEGPADSAGRRKHGLTSYELEPSWQFVESRRACRMRVVSIVARVRVRLPDWTEAESSDAASKAAWDAYITELRKHEHTHRDYVLEAASALFDELQGLNAARCDDLRSDASTRTARAYRALQERQAALDAGEAGR
ncbi:MAG: DUF922 domain-containing protein [Gemmatimonadota bacterium]